MIRQITALKNDELILHLPKEYLNKTIEILIFPVEDEEIFQNIISYSDDILKNTAGLFKNRNIDPVKWQKDIRNEWNRE